MPKISHNFGSRSTAEQVANNADLSGKTIIVTGANSGIGKETARVLAKHRARVIVACRDQTKCNETENELKSSTGNQDVHGMVLDLSSLESIRRFSREFNNKHHNLDILVNNAGVMACPYMKTAEGFELQFGTNHLGHFLLTNLLLESMGEGTRVITVSSDAHKLMGTGVINFDDLQSEKSYSKFGAYGHSKLANILFAREFDRRYRDRGILSFSCHPGSIPTGLTKHQPNIVTWIWNNVASWFLKSIPQGAATQVYLATAPKEEVEPHRGKYFADCNLGSPNAAGTNDEMAKKLWEISAQLVGLN